MANSGEDEFEEIFKLLIAKLYAEMAPDGGGAFAPKSSASATASGVNDLLTHAARRWPGILEDTAIMLLADEHLQICVEVLQPYSILDSSFEVLDALFEYLVNHSSKGAKGQFFTPRHVVDCCVQIIAPRPSELVMDPACGSAGFLIHAFNSVRRANPDLDVDLYARSRLWGFDFDQRAVRVAKTLMLVAGDGNSNVIRLNSLLTPDANTGLFSSAEWDGSPRMTIEDVMRTRSRAFKGFDVILTNPPFAGELKESHILAQYQLTRSGRRMERDVLFIERCVSLLRPGGRIAIVLPHNKFGSPTWAYAREWLVRHLRVVGVLGLGRNTFLPHTHQKTSVLFGIKRDRPVRQFQDEKILFVLSEAEGKDSKGQIVMREGASVDAPMWSRADHDLAEVVRMFHEFIEEQQISWGER